MHLAKDCLTLDMGKDNNEKKIQICYELTVLYLGPLQTDCIGKESAFSILAELHLRLKRKLHNQV